MTGTRPEGPSREVLELFGPPPPSPHLVDGVMAAIERAEQAATIPASRTGLTVTRLLQRRAGWFAAAVAACALLVALVWTLAPRGEPVARPIAAPADDRDAAGQPAGVTPTRPGAPVAPAATGAARPTPDAPLTLERAVLQASMSALRPMISECYEMAAQRDPRIGGAFEARLHLVATHDGETLVEDAAIEARDGAHADDELLLCLRETILSLELPASPRPGRTTVSYPLMFRGQ